MKLRLNLKHVVLKSNSSAIRITRLLLYSNNNLSSTIFKILLVENVFFVILVCYINSNLSWNVILYCVIWNSLQVLLQTDFVLVHTKALSTQKKEQVQRVESLQIQLQKATPDQSHTKMLTENVNSCKKGTSYILESFGCYPANLIVYYLMFSKIFGQNVVSLFHCLPHLVLSMTGIYTAMLYILYPSAGEFLKLVQ